MRIEICSSKLDLSIGKRFYFFYEVGHNFEMKISTFVKWQTVTCLNDWSSAGLTALTQLKEELALL